jgi:sialic acid synthase SpsE
MRRDGASFRIRDRRIGPGEPLYVVAEIGLNHGGSLDRAIALVDAAADAGADAIKLQTLEARALVAPQCPAPAHVHVTSLTEFFASFELDEAAHVRIVARARERGLACLATPLSEAAVDMLDRIGIDAFKIASGDLTWPQLIGRAAKTGRPLIISTGLATLAEVTDAVSAARAAGAQALALLHCVSAYPVPRGSENLRAIDTLQSFGVPVGLSDHGADTAAVPVAVTLGASIYERHIELDDEIDAVDHDVSSTAAELAAAIATARLTRAALGDGRKIGEGAESVNRTQSRRALCAARDLPGGHVIAASDVIALRPAIGLAPAELPRVIGASLRVAVQSGQAIRREDIETASQAAQRRSRAS